MILDFAGRFLVPDDSDVIYIGKGLAEAMGVQVGDRVTLTGRSTHEQMRQRTMTVIGIYDLNIPEIEKRTVYMSLPEAQDLYGLKDQSTEVGVVLKQLGEEAVVIAAIEPGLPDYEIESWEDNYPELIQAISSKGAVMNIMSVVILLIAGIGILNLLLMAIYERTREIGLLGALGFRPRQIWLLFVLEGIMIGLVGIAAGTVLGLAFNGLLMRVGLDYTQFSSLSSSPSVRQIRKSRLTRVSSSRRTRTVAPWMCSVAKGSSMPSRMPVASNSASASPGVGVRHESTDSALTSSSRAAVVVERCFCTRAPAYRSRLERTAGDGRLGGMSYYTGRRVLVTGAASGIGLSMAEKMGAAGARLVLWDLNANALERFAPASPTRASTASSRPAT